MQMYTDNVVQLAFGRALIPFQVSVSQDRGGGRAQQLIQEVTLTGVSEPSNFLTVTSPRLCTGKVFKNCQICTPVHTLCYSIVTQTITYT